MMKHNPNKQNLFALLTALMLLATVSGCGEDSTADNINTESSIAEESSAADESAESEDAGSETEGDADSTESGTGKTSDKAETTAKPGGSTSNSEGSTTTKTSGGGNTASGSNKTSGSSASGGNTSSGGASGSNSDTNSAVPDDDDDEEEAGKPTKYIYLQDTTAQYSGEGITVKGSTVTISKGGTYEITGSLSNGQIYILTDNKKVRLHLNGVDIKNNAGAAINCQKAKKLTINTLAGSVNYLEDGGTHDADKGTIFSEDTVVLKGEGELNITANYAHGVQSDDDIVMNGGTVNITSVKSALHSNDGIEINGGWLYCDGGTNGIKTDGYITITGGSSVFLGGTREEKGAIYCDGSFTVTGGQFWAIGNTCATPDASTTTANVIGLMFPSAQQGGTLVNVSSGNNGVFTMTSPRSFKYVVYTGPDLLTNAEYSVDYGGSCDGSEERYVYFGGSYTYETDGGSFTAGNTVTFYTVQ